MEDKTREIAGCVYYTYEDVKCKKCGKSWQHCELSPGSIYMLDANDKQADMVLFTANAESGKTRHAGCNIHIGEKENYECLESKEYETQIQVHLCSCRAKAPIFAYAEFDFFYRPQKPVEKYGTTGYIETHI